MSKLFPAPIHIHGLSSSRDFVYLLCSQLCCMTFSIHWLKQRSTSLLHPRYCWNAARVRTLECYDDSLVNWRWEWGCFVGKILNFGIWMFKTKILKTQGFFEYKDDRDAWFLDLGTVCSSSFTHMAFFRTTDWKSFLYVISQPHTHTHTKHLVPFWGMGHDSFLNFCTWWRIFTLCLHYNSTQLQQGFL